MFTFRLQTRRNEYGAYVVKCYRDGKRYEEGDYFTNDLEDAKQTLIAMIEHSKKEGLAK